MDQIVTYRPHGKHVSIDEASPEALGICDYTGFLHLRRDLVQQMEYRGNGLVWTGLYVGKDYADVPNEQNRPPILPPDPIPVQNPRPQQMQPITWENNLNIVWEDLIMFTWENWSTNDDGYYGPNQQQVLSSLENYSWGP